MSGVLLVVPPCYPAFMPAIGVSLLKAALRRDGVRCDVLYLNLRFADLVGADLYAALAESYRSYRAWLGEWLFAGDLFGEQAPDPDRYVDEILLGRFGRYFERPFVEQVRALRERVPEFLDRAMEEVAWDDYAIVGLTSTFQQNCASLALLRRIKARHPGVVTAMGGANCEGVMGAALHELFPFVDYVCSGEGDRAFPLLVRTLLAGRSADGLPGILARGGLNLLGDQTHAPIVLDLDRLPYPDYDDYFAQHRASAVGAALQPWLSFETSRGCWWGEKHHCVFCGLNGEGMQYRSKSGERALAELDYLMARYDVRRFQVADNILDLRYFETFLKDLARRPLPPKLFYETKANLTKEQLRLLARAGVDQIQPGIESLSTPILRLMDKGVTALQNVRLLKWCAEVGVEPAWTLLYGFPGEDPAEYDGMAALVPSLVHLQPPRGDIEPLRIDRFSPHFGRPEAYGFSNVRAEAAYAHIYPFPPAALDRLAYHFEYDYAAGHDPGSYTAALRAAVTEWRAIYPAARLELRLEGEQLELRDTRPAAVRATTVLRGAAGLAYLALDAGRTPQAVETELARELGRTAPSLEQIEQWLGEWLAARLVMREGPRYLSLAVNPNERVQLPAERLVALVAGAAS